MPRPRRNVAVFDERRNTSHVIPVSPFAVEQAQAAVDAWRRSDPDGYAWLVNGQPELTAEEYEAWRRAHPIRKSKR